MTSDLTDPLIGPLTDDPTDPVEAPTVPESDVAASEAATRGAVSTFFERVAGRVLRRPLNWWNEPWPTDRVVRVLVTSSALVVTTAIMMWIVHLNPIGADNLVFTDTTPTGGDMGAHVWAPAFLRDHFLPNFQLSGWSMDWYAGLPLYRFYMVVPALAIVALDVVLP
jgi:hypothetical protein